MTRSGIGRHGFDRRALIAGGTAAIAGWSFAASAGAVQAATATGDDMAVLRAAMDVHPGLLRYSTRSGVDGRLDRLARMWSNEPALESRYLALSRFLATIRCGHSYANFFNQSGAVAAALYERRTKLPLSFVWIDGEMVVLADHSGSSVPLPRGTRVTELNGVATGELLRRLLPIVRADGSNDAKRVALLEVIGTQRIETFDVFQGLLFPPPGGVHRLRVVTPDGAQRAVELPAIDQAARLAAFPPRTDDAEPWQWAMRGDVALLTMPGWGLYNSRFAWAEWLETRLDSLGGAKGLVIDIRANEGGLDCGDPILARLVDAPVPLSDAEQRIRFRTLPPLVNAHSDTWDDAFRTMGEGATPLADGFYLRPGGEAMMRIDPAPPARRLRLPVALLTSPTNSSATFAFAEAAKRTGAMRLFGGPTGGNRRGINGGAFMFVRLPTSGIEFDLPLVGSFPREPQPDEGVVPDVALAPGASDIAAGLDPVMDAAMAWVRRA